MIILFELPNIIMIQVLRNAAAVRDGMVSVVE